MEYVVHLHNHAGWLMQVINAESIDDAIDAALEKRAGFLRREYAGKYKIEHDDKRSEFPRYRVVWDDDEPKTFPSICGFHAPPLQKGDVWWSERFQIGDVDDCPSCGGTGRSHYVPGQQCWKCGERGTHGLGTGKLNASEMISAEGGAA